MAEQLHDEKLVKGKKGSASTQQYLDIEEIKEDTVILKNGNLRAVLAVSSINFALKSTQEQDSIIYAYQGFLNSIDFPIQIVINSRKFNISDYLEKLKKVEEQQSNELLRIQIVEYRKYIQSLVEIANIMSKTFYIVVPFSPVESNLAPTERFKIGKEAARKQGSLKHTEKDFKRYKSQLAQRVSHVQNGLSGVGIKMVPLETSELIELYYTLYNPEATHEKKLADPDKLEIQS
jgi:type IV secretory pathway VirB4 component